MSLQREDESKTHEIFSALANETRFRIVKELFDGPKSFTDIARTVKVDSPILVHHLNKLLDAALLIKRNSEDPNSSQYRIYELSPRAKRFLDKVLAWQYDTGTELSVTSYSG